MSDVVTLLREAGRREQQRQIRASGQYEQHYRRREGLGGDFGYNPTTILDGTAPSARSIYDAGQLVLRENTDRRSGAEQLRDFSLGVANGLAQGTLSLAALGASAVTAPSRIVTEAITGQEQQDLGTYISEFSNVVGDTIGRGYSESFQDQRRSYEMQQRLRQEANAEVAEERRQSGWHPWAAGAANLYDDATNTAGNLFENGAVGTDVIAQGGGSLLLGGPIAKAVGAAGRLATGGMAARGWLSARAAAASAEAIEGAAMTSTIAAMEAGGAYNDAVNTIMAMSHDELMADSEVYRSLIQNGLSRDEARREIASQAGTLAATVQAPVGAATGRLVEGFERAPAAVRGFRESLRNVGRETLEESVQSGSGAFARNLGLRWSGANPDQDLSEGVGQGIAEGAVGGFGSAGALQLPGIVGGAAVETADIAAGTAVRAGRAAVGGLVNRGIRLWQERRDELEEGTIASARNDLNVTPEQQDEIQQAVQLASVDAVTSGEMDQAEADTLSATIGAVFEAVRFNPESLNEQSEFIRDVITSGLPTDLDRDVDIFDALRTAAGRLVNDKSLSDSQKAELGVYIRQTLDTNSQAATVIPQVLRMLPSERADLAPARARMESFVKGIGILQGLPGVQKAMKVATEAAERAVQAADVDDVAVATPEAVLAREVVIDQARTAPEKLNNEVAETLVSQAERGLIEMTPADRGLLKGTVSLNTTLKNAVRFGEAMRLKARPDVARTLERNDPRAVETARDVQQRGGAYGLSAREHGERVIQAMSEGNIDEAQNAMSDLRLFAQHMSNKTDAVNRSYEGDQTRENTSEPFQAYSSATKGWFDSSFFVQNKSEASVATAQQVGVDARIVAEVHNAMAAAYPELGVQPFQASVLNPELTAGPAKKVVDNWKRKQALAQADTQRSKPTATPSVQAAPQPAQSVVDRPATTNEVVEAEVVVDELQVSDLGKADESELLDKKPGVSDDKVTKEGYLALLPEVEAKVLKSIAKKYSIKEFIEHLQNNSNVMFSGIIDLKGNIWDIVESYGQSAHSDFFDEVNANLPVTDDDVILSDYYPMITIYGGEVGVRDQGKAYNEKQITKLKALQNQLQREGFNLELSSSLVQEVPTEVEAPVEAEAETVEPAETVEAEPETVEEQAEIEAQDKPEIAPAELPKTIKDAYPNLAQDTMGNLLETSFKPQSNQSSRLFGRTNPLGFVRDALSSPAQFEEATGNRPTRLSGKVISAFHELFENNTQALADKMYERLLRNFVDKKASKRDQTFAQMLGQDKVLNWRDLRAANLLIQDENGFNYQPDLLVGGILAAYDWMINGMNQRGHMKAEDVAKAIGISEFAVSPELVREFNNGVSASEATVALANKMVRFWGLEDIDTALAGHTQGVAQAFAAEMIMSMEEAGLIRIEKLKLPFDAQDTEDAEGVNNVLGARDLNQIRFNKDLLPGQTETELSPLMQFPDAIEAVVLQEREEVGAIIGEPSAQVAKFQLRNNFVETTEEQRQVIERLQNVPFFFSETMVKVYLAMGREGMRDAYGEGDLTDRKLNKQHRDTLDGRNLAYTEAYDEFISLYEAASAYAEEQGIAVHEVPVYFRYAPTRVNRMMMLGRYNPQSNKLMREVLLPTVSVLDLTDETSQSFENWRRALAQAWGVKVHKKTTVQWQADLDARIEAAQGLLPSLVQAIQNDVMPADLSESIPAALGNDLSTWAGHALVDYARWLAASPEDRQAFTTHLYVEADGVTNGPANGMMFLTTGEFTAQFLRQMGRTGMYLSDTEKTLNDHHSEGGDNARDMYEVSGAQFVSQKKLFRDKQSAPVKEIVDAVDDVMRLLLPGMFKLNQSTGKLEFDRSVTKNPLTIVMYGSSAMGIGNKFTGEITAALYERISAAMERMEYHQGMSFEEAFFLDVSSSPLESKQTFQKFSKNLGLLMNNQVRTNRQSGGLYVAEVSTPSNPVGRDPVNYEVSYEALKNLTGNLRQVFVAPMITAIQKEMGTPEGERGVLVGARLLQQTTGAMGEYARAFYLNLIREAIEKRKAEGNYNEADFLSKKEVRDIMKQMEHLLPFVHAEEMSFLIGGTEKFQPFRYDSKNRKRFYEIARAMDGTLGTNVSINGVSSPGVSGIPYMVQGMGDGYMMQKLSLKELEGQLLIYDGANLSLNNLQDNGQKANEAAYETWMGTGPMKPVNEAFQSFIKDVRLDGLATPDLALIGRAAGMDAETLGLLQTMEVSEARSYVKAELDYLSGEMQEASLQVEARRLTLESFNMSVDQMASIQKPYLVTGKISVAGLSDEQVVALLNKTYREKLASLREQTADAVSDDISKLLNAAPQDRHGVRTVRSEEVLGLLKNTKAHANIRETVGRVSRALNEQGYRILMGTPEQLADWAGANGVDVSMSDGVRGAVLIKDRVILVQDGSTESLVHELIHAATMELTMAAVSNPQSVSSHVVEAVSRIEALKDQWLASGEDIARLRGPAIRRAYEDAVAEIIRIETDPTLSEAARKAAALNEFMAWNLSNQDLIRLGQQTKVFGIAKIVRDVLNAVRNLFWPNGGAPRLDNSLWSNLQFNTAIILEAPVPSVSDDMQQMIMYHRTSLTEDEHLDQLRDNLAKGLGLYQQIESADGKLREQEVEAAVVDALNLQERVEASGFPMTDNEAGAFVNFMALYRTSIELNPALERGLADIHAQVVDQLSVDALMSDPNSTDPDVRYQAQQQYDLLTGAVNFGKDARGRGLSMPLFAALGATHKGLRDRLAQMPLKTLQGTQWGTVDSALSSSANEAMNLMDQLTSGQRPSDKNAKQAVSRLVQEIGLQVSKERSIVAEQLAQIGQLYGDAEDFIVKYKDLGIDLGIAQIEKMEAVTRGTPQAKAASLLAVFMKTSLSMIHKDRASEVAEMVSSSADKANMWLAFRELISEVMGMTEENASVMELTKIVRTMIQQTRQQYREQLPKKLAEKFKRPLEEHEWKHLHQGMGQTDLSVFLDNGMNNTQALALLSDQSAFLRVKNNLEADLKAQHPVEHVLIEKKARQLANFMITGEVGHNLLRNANTVANLHNERKSKGFQADDRTVRAVDQLTTLYALELLPQATRDTLKQFASAPDLAEGMEFALSYLLGQRREELSKASGTLVQNHFKGHIPTDREAGRLIVSDDFHRAELEALGYQRVADYEASMVELVTGLKTPKKGYYFSSLDRGRFNQGIFQTIRPTVSGVDVALGHTADGLNAGMITHPKVVAELTQTFRMMQDKSKSPLMPHTNENGEIIAFERALDPAIVNQWKAPKKNLAASLGIWRGRQVEELMADKFNMILLTRLEEMSKREFAEGRRSEYVDLMDKNTKDPVILAATSLLSPSVRAHVQNEMGGKLWVRKHLINDAIGYHDPSVGDFWTGRTRFTEEQQELMKNALTGIFGINAYSRLVKAERAWMNLMSDARVLIVVKSVIVPVANMVSNFYHLISRGVGMVKIVKELPNKISEVNVFLKSQERQKELEAELRVADANGDLSRNRKITQELQALRDANRRLSIWPLLEAGELASISEGLTDEDLNMTQGRVWDYLSNLADKLPRPLKTAGRYALVTKDTALFQGLAKTVAYGDFLAKAILYDHWTKAKKMDHRAAIRKLSEEFVNYDRLPGRTRTYLEKSGMIWFWHFKLRSMKIAGAMLRENPLSLLLAGALPAPAGADTAFTANMGAVVLDNKLGYSILPGQALRSLELLPVANLFD